MFLCKICIKIISCSLCVVKTSPLLKKILFFGNSRQFLENDVDYLFENSVRELCESLRGLEFDRFRSCPSCIATGIAAIAGIRRVGSDEYGGGPYHLDAE